MKKTELGFVDEKIFKEKKKKKKKKKCGGGNKMKTPLPPDLSSLPETATTGGSVFIFF